MPGYKCVTYVLYQAIFHATFKLFRGTLRVYINIGGVLLKELYCSIKLTKIMSIFSFKLSSTKFLEQGDQRTSEIIFGQFFIIRKL